MLVRGPVCKIPITRCVVGIRVDPENGHRRVVWSRQKGRPEVSRGPYIAANIAVARAIPIHESSPILGGINFDGNLPLTLKRPRQEAAKGDDQKCRPLGDVSNAQGVLGMYHG